MGSTIRVEANSLRPGETKPVNAQSSADLRMRQRDLLADLGTSALKSSDLDALFQEACRLVAEGLGVRFCKVLELLPGERRLLVRAGVGWRDGVVGHARLEADDGSAAGHALRTDQPVIANDLEAETRFRVPQLLRDHGIVRAINVIIRVDGRPFGVLEADSSIEAPFSESDLSFLHASASLLGVAIERANREAELKQEVKRREILAREADHRIKNSLQMVASVLTLQRSALRYPQAVAALDEAIARVMAVAESHRALQQSADLRTIALGRMVTDLCEHVGQLSATIAVQCSCDEGMELDAERAIPLGLIISELVTNAFRHAYPDGQRGTVRVRATTTGESVEITIADDGVGIAEAEFGKGGGLGATIVNSLARQIGADLSVRSGRGQGTVVTLRLPKKATATDAEERPIQNQPDR
jgi:two-component sensor histidine kinase